MELTREEAIKLHRQMWRWIAEETEKQKRFVSESEYFEAMGIEDEDVPHLKSYCCEYGGCGSCPIQWSEARNFCLDKNSPYRAWERTADGGSWQVAAELARKIAELPERKMNKDYE